MAISDDFPENSVSIQKLTDQTGSGEVEFYRVFQFDLEDGGLTTTYDLDLAGNPYTVQGTVTALTARTFNSAVAAGKVNADGTIDSIFNSTVTRLSTGNYRVTFLNNQPSANYPILITVESTPGQDDIIPQYTNITSTSFDVFISEQDNGGTAGVPIDNAFSFFIPNLTGDLVEGSSHSALSGLAADDHPQYFNEPRGDARYYTQTQLNSGQLDNRYYTETETDTQISNEITTHSNAADPHSAYETSLQLDNRDTANRSRANHTGTQLSSTISDFESRVRDLFDNQGVISNTTTTNATATNITHTTLTFTAKNTGSYLIEGSFIISLDNVSNDYIVEMVQETSILKTAQVEVKDPNADQRVPGMLRDIVSLIQGQQYTFTIRFRPSNAGDIATMYSSVLTARRILT